MDNSLAKRLKAITHNPALWEALQEHLKEQQTLARLELETETSELVLYRSQGKLSSLRDLLQLKQVVESKINHKPQTEYED